MSLVRWMAIAALAAAHGGVAAQETSRLLNPADPVGAASSVKYESAFDNYQQMQEGNEPSIEVWRNANNKMKELGGHAGHIKAASNAVPAAAKQQGQAAEGADPVAGKSESKPVEGAATSAAPAEKVMPANHGNHDMDNKTKGK